MHSYFDTSWQCYYRMSPSAAVQATTPSQVEVRRVVMVPISGVPTTCSLDAPTIYTNPFCPFVFGVSFLACLSSLAGNCLALPFFVLASHQIGAYHTLDLELNQVFSIEKDVWDVIHLERIETSSDPAKKVLQMR